MNRKDILNDYISILYNEFVNKSFDGFVSFFNSYNTVDTNNEIVDEKIFAIYNKVIEFAKKNNISYLNDEFNISFLFKGTSVVPKVKVYVPLTINDVERFCNLILPIVLKENIGIDFEFIRKNSSVRLCLRFKGTGDFKKLLRYLKQDKEYFKMVRNKISPFIPVYEDYGIVLEYNGFDYLDFVVINLIDFFSLTKYSDNYNIDSFCSFINDKIFSSKYIVIRRMYVALYRCLKCISDGEDIFDVFAYDSSMNISSVNPNDYNVRFDENKVIYFVNIFDSREVRFGDEFYLNVAYSKFYNRSIEMNESNLFYEKFYDIYNKLINSNFNFDGIVIDFDSVDDIYKQLLLFSSGFFALKKFGFKLDEVYKIIQIFCKNILNLEIEIVKNEYIETEEEKERDEIYNFPFDEEFAKSTFNLKNGDITTVIAYFKLNNVLKTIPLNSKVNMKNGSVVSGKDFLEDIKYIAYKYDSFKELIEDLVVLIEY